MPRHSRRMAPSRRSAAVWAPMASRLSTYSGCTATRSTRAASLSCGPAAVLPIRRSRTRQAFVTAFPGIDATFTVRYSTEHSALIDRQLALGGLEPDLIQLQTLYDFDHWKAQNALLPYRPPGAEAVFPQYRDPDDAYIGILVPSFGRVSNSALLSDAEAPRDASRLSGARVPRQDRGSGPHRGRRRPVCVLPGDAEVRSAIHGAVHGAAAADRRELHRRSRRRWSAASARRVSPASRRWRPSRGCPFDTLCRGRTRS